MKNQVWKIKLDKLDHCPFQTWIFQATQAVKIKFEINKKKKLSLSNLNFQTRIFKNLVQINKGIMLFTVQRFNFVSDTWHCRKFWLRKLLSNTLFDICPKAKTSVTAMTLFYTTNTLFQSKNEWQKTEQVPISLPRASPMSKPE